MQGSKLATTNCYSITATATVMLTHCLIIIFIHKGSGPVRENKKLHILHYTENLKFEYVAPETFLRSILSLGGVSGLDHSGSQPFNI